MSSQSKTVREYFEINELLLEELAESKNPYWEKVSDFYEQVHDRNADTLSEGQLRWLSMIVDQLEEIETKRASP